MTRDRVEQFATSSEAKHVSLELCEEGIAHGRRMMAEMLGGYSAGETDASAVQAAISNLPGYKKPEDAASDTVAATEVAEAKCPVPAAAIEALKAQPVGDSKCPAAGMMDSDGKIAFTKGAEVKVEEATSRVVDAGKFESERAEALTRGVALERGKEKRMLAINESFMARLGKQLGYGHPLAEVTAEYKFEWTPEAEARLEDVPEFCREMSRWRVEWTAVKHDLGRVITPEIMDIKFDAWGEVSDAYMEREGKRLEWAPGAWARVENIPSFVQGQVVESVEGNARRWGQELVTEDILDKVIDKWIDTGDFHEAQFGYK
jgi:hypothetical protein